MPGSHTADVINAAIRRILEEWEVGAKQCHVFLRDGAANMKKAFEGEFEHADCGAHKCQRNDFICSFSCRKRARKMQEDRTRSGLQASISQPYPKLKKCPKRWNSLKKSQQQRNREVCLPERERLPTPNTWSSSLAMLNKSLSSDPLLYWQKNSVRFPILSKAARRFLSAPSTSVASEQLFSHARDVFDYRRGQLDPINAEQLIFPFF